METREQILTELKEVAPHLGRAGLCLIPFTVEAGYFEVFVENLMRRIHLEDAGLLNSEQSIDGISSTEEISGISPLLAGIQKKNPYRVPLGFFESLNVKIPFTETNPSKIISIPTFESDTKQAPVKRISIPMRLVQFAAAACFIALTGVAVLNTGKHQNTIDPIQGLSNVSDQDMANFLDSADIHWTPGIGSSPETAYVDFNENDIHELLSNVPDAELEQYSSALPVEKRFVN